jgi:uroporphyrinogen decarboxylase
MVARFGRASIEAGPAGVFYAITGYGSAGAMPLREYEELLLPLDRQVLDACSGGWFNLLHLCGPRQHFELASALPAQCVNWQLQDPGNPGLAEGRRLSGKAVAGGLHRHSPIADGSPSARREATPVPRPQPQRDRAVGEGGPERLTGRERKLNVR